MPNPASVKHMIVISDGDPSPPSATIAGAVQEGQHQDLAPSRSARTARRAARVLQNIATATGGKYYVVNNPKALPRIFQSEARRVARPLVKERRGRACRWPSMTRRTRCWQSVDAAAAGHGLRADDASRRIRWSKC